MNWFGDSLDGTLARYRKIERPRYGFYIDHMIDMVSELLVFVGLGLSPYLRMDIAVVGLVCYLLASVYIYIVTYVSGVFRIAYSGISPTELRLVAIAANTLVFLAGNPVVPVPTTGLLAVLGTLTVFDLLISGVILIIIVLLSYNSVTTGINLAREDRALYEAKKQQEEAPAPQASRDRFTGRKAKTQSRQVTKIV